MAQMNDGKCQIAMYRNTAALMAASNQNSRWSWILTR